MCVSKARASGFGVLECCRSGWFGPVALLLHHSTTQVRQLLQRASPITFAAVCTLLAGSVPGLADVALRPFVVLPRASVPPAINGNPAGGAWERAAWVGNPVYLNAKEITPKFTMQVGLLWDETALYVGFRVFGFRKPLAITTTKGDDGLERDDAVEVCFKVPGFEAAKGQPVQFKLNCVGQRDDAIGFDFNWNARWDGAVQVQGYNWSATFKIPFANFGVMPKEGDRWEANFAAYLMGYSYRGFLWSSVVLGHHHQGDFGTIQFGSANTPANAIGRMALDMTTLRVSGSLGSPGSVRILLFPGAGGQEKQVLLGNVIANFDEEGRAAAAQKVCRVEKAGEWSAVLEGLRPGSYLAKVIVMDAAGQPLNVDVKPVKVSRSIETRILKYPVAGSGSAVVTVYDMGKPGLAPAVLKVSVLDSTGVVLREVKEALPGKLPVERMVSLGRLKNRATYKVLASAATADGATTVEDAVEFQLPERPAWADAEAGALNGRVLKPWTPIRAKGAALSCWGRTYDLGDSSLPVGIVSSGHKILADRVRVVAGSASDTVTIDKAKGPPKVQVSKTGDVAEFESIAGSTLCELAVKGFLDFDGFMAFGLTVKPKKKVDSLAVEIPLDNALARYIQPLPGATNRDGAGAIPEPGVAMGPVNTLWICSEKAGLFFVCESTQFWKAPPDKAVEVIRRATDTLLRLNFFRSPEGFEGQRTYRFSLQATPVRPYNPDWFANGSRVANGLTWHHHVQALEEDTVLSLPLGAASSQPVGALEILLQNESDFKAVTEMDYDHYGSNENILSVTSPAGKVSLLYSKPRNAMTLTTPWGELGLKGNALWKPRETHKLAFTWGDKLRFFVDGNLQGELAVTSLPLPNAKLNLGSISACYLMRGLRAARSVDPDSLADTRPMVKTADTFLYRGESLNLRSNARTPLHVFKEFGGKTLIFFEHWCHAQNGGRSDREPLLKKIVADCHRLGLKVLLYFGFELADLLEHEDLIDECKSLVNQGPNFYAPQRQNTYWVSYGSPYQEYLLHNMKRLKEEMGIDGVYLDGSLSLSGSDNPALGCGYVDESGARVPTVPVERIREFAKRINNLFVQEGGVVFAHLGVVPPTMGFVSNTYLGEHVGFLNTEWQTIDDRIPPEVARAIYAGRNTGVPMVLCIQNMAPHLRGVKPDWYARASSWADLYGVGVNVLLESPMCKEGLELMAKNRLLAEFGADTCEWIPCWETERLLTCDPKDLKVSLFRRKDGAMVCAIANMSAKGISGCVDFSGSAKLSVKAGAKAQELISGKPVRMQGGKVYVALPSYEHLLVRVE